MKARVTVRPRPEILDPQGKAILSTLGSGGYSQVTDLRAGKSFDLVLDVKNRKEAEEVLDEICKNLLSNPLIETYEYELEDA